MKNDILAASALAALLVGCADHSLPTVGTCAYGGHTHKVGETFPSDGCNACTCKPNGEIECTMAACLGDAGYLTADVQMPGVAVDGAADSPLADLRADTMPRSDGLSDPDESGSDQPDQSVGPADVSQNDDATLSPETTDSAGAGLDLTGERGEGEICHFRDAAMSPGVSISDGCNVCSCSAIGIVVCTERACPGVEAGSPDCVLPDVLRYVAKGRTTAFEDLYQLEPEGGMTITRTYLHAARYPIGTHLSCAPILPSCGAPGVVSLSNIVADVNDPEAQAALTGLGTVFGTYPSVGPDFISLGTHDRQVVGVACPASGTTPCTPIPAGLQRLVDDILSLASAMLADPACVEL